MAAGQQISIDFTPTLEPPVRRPSLTVSPSLVTVVEAARALGIGRSKAYELIASGDLEVVHIGRAARVPVDAIDDLVIRLRAQSRR